MQCWRVLKDSHHCCLMVSSWRPRRIWRGRGPSAACLVLPLQPSPFLWLLAGCRAVAQPRQTPTGCLPPHPPHWGCQSHCDGQNVRVRGGEVNVYSDLCFYFLSQPPLSQDWYDTKRVRWDEKKKRWRTLTTKVWPGCFLLSFIL